MNNIDKFYTSNAKAFAGRYLEYLKSVIDKVDLGEISAFIGLLVEARNAGRSIFFIGNGGSAATASHFANDLAIGTNDYVKPIKAIALTDNIPIITAIGNDYGYDDIFERQLRVLANKGDIIVAISASGNSPNLVKAFEYAKSNDIKAVSITAFTGGVLREMADLSVFIPTDLKEYGPAEDLHMILDHLINAYFIRFVKEGN